MRLRLSFVALLLLISPAVIWGQGLVDGTVVNGNQFVGVPGKTVHLVNDTMKPPVDRTAVTDDQGYYSFENVAPGDGYSVEVLSDTGKPLGFDSALHFSIANDQKHTALPNIDIAKGVSAEETTKANGLIANDTTTAQGANVSNEQLRQLPLYNRTFLALGLLQPGVHDVEQGSPLQGAAFSIAGARATSTDFLLNSLEITESAGVDNVASSNNQAIPFQVNEAVQDFRVIYATPELRYSQGSGGVVDVVTSQGRLSAKGGLSAWHGGAFGYFNNDVLNSATPLSVYSNSGFTKAAAYADGAPTANPYISYSGYFGFAPQSYNALYGLLKSGFASVAGDPYGSSALDPTCATSLCAAGSFSPASVLASQDSHTFPVSQQQFGVSAGGPLFDGKLLFFASYEGTLINNPTPIFERVPTTLDNTPSALSGTSDSSISQGVLALLPKPNVGYGTSASSNAGIFGFYRGTAPNYTHVHNIHVRPDIPLGAHGTISLRYTGQLLDQLHDDTLPAGGAYPGNGADRKAQNQSAAVTYNRPLGRHINVLNLGFTQFRVDEVAQDRNFNAASVSSVGSSLPPGALATFVISGIDTQTTGAKAGHPGYMGGWYDSFWNADCTGTVACPSGATSSQSPSPITPSLDGDFPLARIGAPLSAPSAHRDTEAFVSDLIELRLGNRNTLSAGGDYRYQQNFSFDGGLTRGLVVSNNIGEFTSDSETCVSCGHAFSNPSFDYELRQPTPYVGDLRSSSFGLFAEDKFQATDRFVLTGGIRYGYFGEPLDTQGRLWNYNNVAQGLVRQGATGTYDAFDYQCGGVTSSLDSIYGARRVGFPSGWNCSNSSFFLPDNKHDFTGRLGVSYAPGEGNRNVWRAAAGGYYDHLPASYNEKLLQNRPSPFNATNPSAIYGQNFDSPYSSTSCQAFTQCAFGMSTLNFSGLSPTNTSTLQNYQAASGANVLYERDANKLRTPYSFQFSAGFQHQFGNAWNAEVAFVGSAGHRLPLVYDSNFNNEFYCTQGGSSTAPGGLCNNNTFFPVFTQSNIGASNYNSLVARVDSQRWHGLSVHAAYTYARSLDDIAGSDFPQTVDSLWSQLFGRQLLGMGNPVAFALGANSLNAGSAGFRGSQLNGTQARTALQTGGNIPSFNAIQSALTTTGSRPVTVSHYTIPQNPLAFSSLAAGAGGDYGPSDFNVGSRAVADFVYSAPDFGHRWAGGFLVAGVFVGQTGQPFSIFSGPAYGQVTQRVSAVSGSPIRTTGNPTGYISGITSANLVSTQQATACPNLYAVGKLYTGTPVAPYACPGNTGRNSFTGPAFISQDLAIQKTTRVYGENHDLVLRAEFFNLFNRANYYNPISEYSLDGVHVNPEFGLVRSAHDPRQIQLAVRYAF